jgi:hypothetical protein
MKGVFVLLLWMTACAVGIAGVLSVSPTFPTLWASGFVMFAGMALIVDANTDKSKLTPEQLERRKDVGCFTFVFLPVVMAMFTFAFIVWPALTGAK